MRNDATESMTERIRYWEGVAESTIDRDARMRALRWALAWRRLQLQVLKAQLGLELRIALRGVVDDRKGGGETEATWNTSQRTNGTLDRGLSVNMGRIWGKSVERTLGISREIVKKALENAGEMVWDDEGFRWIWWEDGYFFTHNSLTIIRRPDGSIGHPGER